MKELAHKADCFAKVPVAFKSGEKEVIEHQAVHFFFFKCAFPAAMHKEILRID